MIHVLLRAAVWVAVFGIGYLLLGPELFDSSRDANPFESTARIYLPPAKSQREIEYERIMDQRSLAADELAHYRAIVQERQSKFWQQEGVSVEEALAGFKTQRRRHLATILEQRGVTKEEAAVFFLVLERDHPTMLADQE
jgi:hypothetical protein